MLPTLRCQGRLAGLVPRKERREDYATARHAALREINYHPQSGWFEEGPTRANGQTGHLRGSSRRTGGRAKGGW
jgi:hypothetical protein